MLNADEDHFGSPVSEPPVRRRSVGETVVVPAQAGRSRSKPVQADTTPADRYAGPIEFVIYGEPASKANSRELATVGPKDKRRMIFRKSDVALKYEEQALRQIPPKFRLQLTCMLAMTLRIFYTTEANDLDESIVLDVMQNRYKLVPVAGQDKKHKVLLQAGVYVNDRQVRERHVYHGIDKMNPRAEIRIESISPQEVLL